MAFQPSGKVGPCCAFELEDTQELVLPIEKTFVQERADFLSGKVPSGCKKCHYSYLETGKSYADEFETYETDFDTVNIQEINVKANNICNLACRSCGPHFSSRWEEEFAPVIKITKDNLVFEKLKLLDMQSLKKIVIAGGEPTLAQDHVSLLQLLQHMKRTDVEIRIATNLTSLKYKEIDLVDLWKNFSKLILHISLDAVGDRASNIRSGTNWNSVSNNLTAVIHSGINYYVMTTVSALNIWFLEDTVQHLKKKQGVRHLKLNKFSRMGRQSLRSSSRGRPEGHRARASTAAGPHLPQKNRPPRG
jgi:sulfatase maturation enzyme AslB (radical SAM superfamily)